MLEVDEPLLGSAEDHRVVTSPAVRIAVRQLAFGEQRAAFAEQSHDARVGLEHSLALVLRQAFEEAALIVKRRVDLKAILLPGVEVFGAVAQIGRASCREG